MLCRSSGDKCLSEVRVHACKNNPCTAVWDMSKFGDQIPIAFHLQPSDWQGLGDSADVPVIAATAAAESEPPLAAVAEPKENCPILVAGASGPAEVAAPEQQLPAVAVPNLCAPPGN